MEQRPPSAKSCASGAAQALSPVGVTSAADAVDKEAPTRMAAPSRKNLYGPERFFYDRTSYTGCHAKGGPESVAKGGGSASDSSWKRPNSAAGRDRVVATRSGPKEAAAVHTGGPTLLRRGSSGVALSAHEAVKEFMDHGAKVEAARRPSSRGGTGSDAHMQLQSPAGASPARVSRRLVGPERFFYDRSTYTGCHTRGGPSSVAKGGGSSSDQSWKRPS